MRRAPAVDLRELGEEDYRGGETEEFHIQRLLV
jgi:hypothetical protein